MAYKEAELNSLKYAIANGEWMTILKRKDAEAYFPIYMDATQAGRILSQDGPS